MSATSVRAEGLAAKQRAGRDVKDMARGRTSKKAVVLATGIEISDITETGAVKVGRGRSARVMERGTDRCTRCTMDLRGRNMDGDRNLVLPARECLALLQSMRME